MTTTRQLLNDAENKLDKSLSKVYNKIQANLDTANWSDIQRIYKRQTDDIIRAGVTDIYQISAKKTTERDIKVPYFLTQQDLAEIKRLTQKYQDSFWISLDREVRMRSSLGTTSKYDPVTLLLVTKEDKSFRQGFISRISMSVHGEVAGSAVLSKARQVVPVGSKTNAVNRLRVVPTKTTSRYRVAAVGSGQELIPHVTWRTADDSDVCPECSALNGTTYLLDDPSTPVPSETTHPRCRCELVLEDSELGEEEEEEFF